MKRIILFALVLMLVLGVNAQETKKATPVVNKAKTEAKDTKKNYEVIEIQTNGVCQMCKDRILENAPFWKGVKDCRYDMKTSKVRVVYDPTKTTPHRIRESISKLGYDADDVKADANARAKLPACCRAEKGSANSCSGSKESGCSHSCPHAQKNGENKQLKKNDKKEQPQIKKNEKKNLEKSSK